MEGTLLVPPDRGTIIGRAMWKPRYVVVGPALRELQSPASAISAQSPFSPSMSSGHFNVGRVATPKSPSSFGPEPLYFSVYKSKDDAEPQQQFPLSSITKCAVEMVAHRKQGPVLPTLVVYLSPETDKARKRRSSRTALTSIRDSNPSPLWFRPCPDDHRALHEWSRHIQPLIQSQITDRTPMSPTSPNSPLFSNPFQGMRPPSANQAPRPTLHHMSSAQTHSSRERPLTFSSESPSLRSKRSDVSSHASSINQMGFTMATGQCYTSVGPDNLPSPASTIGEYTGEFIEGWTSAQGRSSTVSSPVRGRDSLGSQLAQTPPALINSSSPPGPRETILDRAFQLRVIPGSDQVIPGEEKLSSLARFDALMRGADEKRKQRKMDDRARAECEGLKSAWDLDETSDEDEDDEYVRKRDQLADERDLDDDVLIGPSAQRALDFIANRHNQPVPSRPTYTRSTISYHPDTLRALSSGNESIVRPRTGYSRNRPRISSRTNSQSQLPVDIPNSPAPTVRADDASLRNSDNRQSTNSAKRLSLNDFTKRLSSTSSLLLVQTNVSAGSSGRSSEIEPSQSSTPVARGSLTNPRAAPAPPGAIGSGGEWDKRCGPGWRGSVGVFGGEGGFL